MKKIRNETNTIVAYTFSLGSSPTISDSHTTCIDFSHLSARDKRFLSIDSLLGLQPKYPATLLTDDEVPPTLVFRALEAVAWIRGDDFVVESALLLLFVTPLLVSVPESVALSPTSRFCRNGNPIEELTIWRMIAKTLGMNSGQVRQI
jgi:hypothetical protein